MIGTSTQPLRVVLIIDYENMVLDRRGVPRKRHRGSPFVLEPTRFARKIVAARSRAVEASAVPRPSVRITGIDVVRALPDPEQEPLLNAATRLQSDTWKFDNAIVEVHSAPCRYFKVTGANQDPRFNVRLPELNILCAVQAFRHAITRQYEGIILASTDRSLSPALSALRECASETIVETVSWSTKDAIAPRVAWNTALDRDALRYVHDGRDYLARARERVRV